MGVALTELLLIKEINIDSLRNRTIAVDSSMWLYQFLSSIRQRDGTLLMDSKGKVTSHLTGLISRIVNLSNQNIKLIFVFDGEAPELKNLTLNKRKEIKQLAQKNFEIAKEKNDLELMKKYAQRTSRLTQEMTDEAKKLVRAFGIPVIEAPSEAEAQASLIVKNSDAYAISTNDADALLFQSPRIVRNLNMAGKKKKMNKLAYETVSPDMISLEENLKHLGLSQDQLISLAMLIGTDFNSGGIKGIGPKTALKMVKNFEDNFDSMFKEAKWSEFFDYPWQDVFDLIKNMPTDKDYKIEWKQPDSDKIMKLLVDEHDFSEERVKSQISELTHLKKGPSQKGLGEFFG
ncbi:MAG TPA: flap endonuclease-1 [Candidatus Nanoarchaeia archaeon]|nr:flap endonuclease-1 [Candidatus Nanoarchaeia archaeon]